MIIKLFIKQPKKLTLTPTHIHTDNHILKFVFGYINVCKPNCQEICQILRNES